ncbi:MAG: M20/M25/M40 family metallo-hydrolase [Planctomycetota bacterium]
MPRTPTRRWSAAWVLAIMCLAGQAAAHAEANSSRRTQRAALDSITADDLLAHAQVLASDAYEGRAAGSRGGRAAASYLAQQLKRIGVDGGAADGGYYQRIPGGRRNVLAKLPGADPALASEWVVLGAHYDHVGYGNRRTSFGPFGYVHNGADDNASGVATVLEIAEAFADSGARPARSILIAFWDGEETGMVGSRHWAANPTTPLAGVKLAINADMIGRLREGRLQVLGARTGYGLRRLASVAVDEGLRLEFPWPVESSSDHWTFLSRGVPAVMLHTGLHGDYHRPSDDVERLNIDGLQKVTRYLLRLTIAAASQPTLPAFRAEGLRETRQTRLVHEQPLGPLPADAPPPRVGISWRGDHAAPGSVLLTRVAPGSPAARAGLAVHDRVLAIDGQAFTGSDGFQQHLGARLAERDGPQEVRLLVERGGRTTPRVVRPRQP